MSTPGRSFAWMLGVVVLLAGQGLAQPSQPEQPPGNGGASPPDRATAREAFRARLQRRLEEAREVIGAIEEALRKLDSGASPEEVRRMLPDRLGGIGPRGRDEPGGDFDRPRPVRSEGPLSEEERTAIRDILANSYPEMARRLEQLREQDPAAFEARLNEMRPRMHQLLDLRKRDPELFRIRIEEVRTMREAMSLARQIVEQRRRPDANSAELKEAETKLRGLIARQSEARLSVLQHELADLRERLRRQEEELARLERDPEKAIDEQLERLLDRVERGEPGPGDGPGPHRPERRRDASPRSDKAGGPPG